MRAADLLSRLRSSLPAGLPALALALALLVPGAAPAEAQAVDRRLVVSEEADYFGGDYETLREVSRADCEAACLADSRCQALTFNSAAGWCFLKETVGPLSTASGAVAARIVERPRLDETTLDDRLAALDMLPQGLRDEARRLRLEIAGERPDRALGDLSDAALLMRAEEGLAYAERSALARETLRRNPGNAEAWIALTRAALAHRPDRYDERRQTEALRQRAAINAAVTAEDAPARAEGLALLGEALELSRNWPLAIRAYRASLAAREDEGTAQRLEALIAAHGFRITGNTVDNNAASPRVCLTFSEPLAPAVTQGEAAGDFVSVEGGEGLPVSASGNQICVEGARHGARYRILVRPGVMSASGEVLERPVETIAYVRDRDPSVRFATHAYVLPATVSDEGRPATIPVTSINTDAIEARVQRVPERALARLIADNTFLRGFATWDVEEISDRDGTDVWTGSVTVESRTNAEVVTAIPVSEIAPALEPGVYVLTAKADNAPASDYTLATQWFVVSRIGLTTLEASDGFHVLTRSLDGAEAMEGVSLELVAVNNAVLASATSDAEGHARIPAGLLKGTGGDRPAVLTARRGDDFVFLDLTAAPFDLTDRGVEGRAPAGALDVFLTLDRGIYRTGETAYLTGTVRDAKGDAAPPLPLVGILRRPDGAEQARTTLRSAFAGGFVWEAALPRNAMRGRWTFAVHADPDRAPLASATALIADFEPEKIDADLVVGADSLDPADPTTVTVDARYLFGAPAAGLEVAGEAVLRAERVLEAYPAYGFGLADEDPVNARQPIEPVRTNAEGRAVAALSPFEAPVSTRPLRADLQVRVIDTDGRPIERVETVPLVETRGRLGLRPLFDGAVGEGTQARFDLIALASDGRRTALEGAVWRLEKITERFQWYSLDGRWNYEPIETRSLVADGTIGIDVADPARLVSAVDWGLDELRVEDPSGEAHPVSARFSAGWYVSSAAVDTPDAARVSLDKDAYAVGDVARVRIEPRFAGPVEVLVLDERVVARVAAEVPAEGGTVEIPVTEDWGPGAYVAAIAYRPMDQSAARMPGRALGLAHAAVDPGARALDVAIEAPARTAPRAPLDLAVTVSGVAPGDTAYLTLAMADEGILGITGFEPPSLSA
ncbi:MAG: MG2 domain-containing protein, partial [Pseudomonadota bacterium]